MMADITALGSMLASLQAAKDVAQAMIGLRDATAFQEKQIEFQSKILDANKAAFAAQDERAAMLERIRKLEKQLAQFEAWEAESQRYELAQLAPGMIAYLVKEEARGTEPPHCICATCYQDRQKSILHFLLDSLGEAHITCPRCKTELKCYAGDGRDFPVPIS